MRYSATLMLVLIAVATSAQENIAPDSARNSKATKQQLMSDPIPDTYQASPELLLEYLKGHRAGSLAAAAQSETLGSGSIVQSIGCFFPSSDLEKAYADGYRTAHSTVSRATLDVYFRTARSMIERFAEIAKKDAEMMELKQKTGNTKSK